MTRHNILVFLMMVCGTLLTQDASAHFVGKSNLFLNFQETSVHGRVEMTVDDINTALDLSLPTDDSVSPGELRPYVLEIQRYVADRVRLSLDGRSSSLVFTDVGVLHLSFASFVQVNFSIENVDPGLNEVDFDYSILFDVLPEHRGLLVIENNWKSGIFDNEANISLVFEPGREQQTLDLSDASTFRGFVAMVRLGTHHIWIGIDHILFLMALLLPAVVQRKGHKWVPVDGFRTALIHVIKVVTVFTVAHTITLSLAALNAVSLSSRLVESVIALSIAIAALNIAVPVFRDKVWIVVFAFGLFHGFGFASALSEIGIPSNYLVHSLLGFNVGVEFGQLAIVVAVFPLLYFMGRQMYYSRFILPAMTTCLITVSLYWFIERAFLIDLPAGAIVNSIVALVA